MSNHVFCHVEGRSLPALYLSTGEEDSMVPREWVEQTRDRLG
jgi:hypothetical protein